MSNKVIFDYEKVPWLGPGSWVQGAGSEAPKALESDLNSQISWLIFGPLKRSSKSAQN